MRMYDYLVSYHFMQEGYLTYSMGTMQVSRKKKINTFEELNQLREFVESNIEGSSNLAIYNFILLGRNKH